MILNIITCISIEYPPSLDVRWGLSSSIISLAASFVRRKFLLNLDKFMLNGSSRSIRRQKLFLIMFSFHLRRRRKAMMSAMFFWFLVCNGFAASKSSHKISSRDLRINDCVCLIRLGKSLLVIRFAREIRMRPKSVWQESVLKSAFPLADTTKINRSRLSLSDSEAHKMH